MKKVISPPQVRVIQGDGVNFESIGEIYSLLELHKISPENLALGMGGKLLQADIIGILKILQRLVTQ
jgi:nicotinic acid phosphoribosyltransferase